MSEYESLQQAQLILRSQSLGLELSTATAANNDPVIPTPLESRQHDYRKGSNPLFRPMSESVRSELLSKENAFGKASSRPRSDSVGSSTSRFAISSRPSFYMSTCCMHFHGPLAFYNRHA